jgi:hypothetical protein
MEDRIPQRIVIVIYLRPFGYMITSDLSKHYTT